MAETDDNGWYKPIKVFTSKAKAIDYAELKQQESNDNNLVLNLEYSLIDIVD